MRRAGESSLLGSPPLAGAVRSKMEQAFGADFGDVRVHQGAEASGIGATAFAQGADIHQGRAGASEAALGHEAAHVIQQRAGLFAGQY